MSINWSIIKERSVGQQVNLSLKCFISYLQSIKTRKEITHFRSELSVPCWEAGGSGVSNRHAGQGDTKDRLSAPLQFCTCILRVSVKTMGNVFIYQKSWDTFDLSCDYKRSHLHQICAETRTRKNSLVRSPCSSRFINSTSAAPARVTSLVTRPSAHKAIRPRSQGGEICELREEHKNKASSTFTAYIIKID